MGSAALEFSDSGVVAPCGAVSFGQMYAQDGAGGWEMVQYSKSQTVGEARHYKVLYRTQY